MIEWFIGVVIGLAIGLTIGILLQKSKLVGRLQALEGEAAGLRRQMEGERSAAAKQVTQIREDASRQMRQLTDRDEALLANERNLHDREMETVRSAHAKQIASLESQIAEERRHATELREENNRQWAQRLDTLREEMQNGLFARFLAFCKCAVPAYSNSEDTYENISAKLNIPNENEYATAITQYTQGEAVRYAYSADVAGAFFCS